MTLLDRIALPVSARTPASALSHKTPRVNTARDPLTLSPNVPLAPTHRSRKMFCELPCTSKAVPAPNTPTSETRTLFAPLINSPYVALLKVR